jgi:predicted O-linked N-acetylglucosamine transferase (SPINDLY family)
MPAAWAVSAMATISEAIAIAVTHHQAGRLDAAEGIYRQILLAEPNQPEALHLLGVVFCQTGKFEPAVEYIGRAIALDGNQPMYHSNLGEAYRGLGQIPAAIGCYRRALQLKPDFAGAYYNLGNVLKDHGQLAAAVQCYRQATRLQPDYADAYNNLGNAHKGLGQTAEAIACFRRALELRPDSAEAHGNLGHVLKDQGQLVEAVACYQRAVQLNPGSAVAHASLGYALQEQRQLTEAIGYFQQALQLKPDLVETIYHLAVALGDQGRVEESLACYRRALELQPNDARTRSAFLLALHFRSTVTLRELAEAHGEFARRHTESLQSPWRPQGNSRHPGRKLRLGILSPLLWMNPAARLLIRPLEGLREQDCRIFCYACRTIRDQFTDRIAAAAHVWRDVSAIDDEALVEQIRADGIDILFDVAGHLACNRLLALARKPAPIQITWLAYEGTTGVAAIDYILADQRVIPAAAEPYYCERVLRLPDGYVCYDPCSEAPPVGTLPARQSGCVTFGSFSNPMKITPAVVRVWANILRHVPKARLLLKYGAFAGPAVQRHYAELFHAEGIASHRIEFAGRSPLGAALAEYNRVDIALDPFPFSGSLTTCDALWMGVPVITCPGETFASRHSLSHLSNVGLTETVAADLDEYVAIAATLADDLARLAALRVGLRERMAASPLCDGKLFAANLMVVMRDIWQQWTAQGQR